MRRVSSLLLLGGCTSMLLAQEVTREIQKTIPLSAGRLRVEHSMGNVTVHTQAKGTVEMHVSIRCRAGAASEARAWCEQIKVAVEESSSGVLLRTDYPYNSGMGHHNESYSVNYDITMPETAPLEVRNRFGAVSVTSLHAAATINNSNGNVVFTGGRGRQRIEDSFGDVEVGGNDGDVTVVNTNGKVTASDITGALEIRDSFGDVRVTNAAQRVTINGGNSNVSLSNPGGTVRITNSFGAVTVRDARSDVTVQNQNGRVEASGVSGIADLRTSFEQIRFARIGKDLTVRASNSNVAGDTVGGSATMETTFGAIELRGVKGNVRATAGNSSIRLTDVGGEAYARTSFGGTSIEEVGGPITVESENGSVTVRPRRTPNSAPACQAISLRTTFAPMSVTIPRERGYDVTARTSFGQITSQPPVTVSGQMGGDSLTGKIGAGGCEMRLIDQNGNIEIRW